MPFLVENLDRIKEALEDTLQHDVKLIFTASPSISNNQARASNSVQPAKCKLAFIFYLEKVIDRYNIDHGPGICIGIQFDANIGPQRFVYPDKYCINAESFLHDFNTDLGFLQLKAIEPKIISSHIYKNLLSFFLDDGSKFDSNQLATCWNPRESTFDFNQFNLLRKNAHRNSEAHKKMYLARLQHRINQTKDENDKQKYAAKIIDNYHPAASTGAGLFAEPVVVAPVVKVGGISPERFLAYFAKASAELKK